MTGRMVLLLAGLPLAACFATGVVLMRMDEHTRRLRARRQAAIGPHLPVQPRAAGRTLRSAERSSASLARTARVLIGMDPDRPGRYPFPPWAVLPAALLPSLAMHWLLHGLLGPAAWLAAPACWAICVRAVYRSSDTRRAATLLRQFPDALSTITRAVRVGIPLSEAMRAVARDASEPTASEFARVHDQITIGTPLDAALRDLAGRSRLPEYRFFATALTLQGQTGGGLAETLEGLADVIRKRVALKARGFALASEARTSAGVLAALPVLSGLALAVLNPAYIAPLLQEGPGQSLFGLAVVWLGTGMLVMRWLIRKSLA